MKTNKYFIVLSILQIFVNLLLLGSILDNGDIQIIVWYLTLLILQVVFIIIVSFTKP